MHYPDISLATAPRRGNSAQVDGFNLERQPKVEEPASPPPESGALMASTFVSPAPAPVIGPGLVHALQQGGEVAAAALTKVAAALKVGGAGLLAAGALLLTAAPAGNPSAELVRAREELAKALLENFPDLEASRDRHGRITSVTNPITGVVVMDLDVQGRIGLNPAINPHTLRLNPMSLDSFSHLFGRERAFNGGPGTIDVRPDLLEQARAAAAGAPPVGRAAIGGVPVEFLELPNHLTSSIEGATDFAYAHAVEHFRKTGRSVFPIPVLEPDGSLVLAVVPGNMARQITEAALATGAMTQGMLDAFHQQLRVIEQRLSPIVVGQSGRGYGAPEGLSPDQQRELGLDGRPSDSPVPRNPAPDQEGFPVGPRGDARDGVFENPRGSGPNISDITPSPGPGDDAGIRKDVWTSPLGGESVPVRASREHAAEGESVDEKPPTIADIAARLVANPPLTLPVASELVSLALGATPETPDSRRLLEVGLAQLGLAPLATDLPAARRAVQARLGGASADDLVVQLSGSADLPELLRRFPEIGEAILTRPKTIESLGQHPQALEEVRRILQRLAQENPLSIRIPDLPAPPQSNLTLDQIAISRAATAAIPEDDFLRNQPGFDQAWRSDPEQISQYLNGLYAAAEAATPEFRSLLENLADTMNGTAQVRPEPKSRKRALDKIEKYGGDASRLTDLVAGRVVFDSIADIYGALAALTANRDVTLVDIEDRILNPQPSGYRDITMKVQLSNGHIAELRFEARSIVQYASEVDHALYEVYRDIAAQAKRSGAGLTDSARFIMNSIRNITIPNYNRLFEEANREQPGGSERPSDR